MNIRLQSWLVHWPIFLWGLLCVSGFSILAVYANTPSPQGALDDAKNLGSSHQGEGMRVFMFIHPKCSCSRASLFELKQAVRKAEGQISEIRFYVTVPRPGSSERWTEERLVSQLREWGFGSTIHFDPGGAIAEKYGALTSGHVVAYNGKGDLIFAGGITGSRGHQGENPGRRQLVRALAGKEAMPTKYAVYGCGLQSSDESF